MMTNEQTNETAPSPAISEASPEMTRLVHDLVREVIRYAQLAMGHYQPREESVAAQDNLLHAIAALERQAAPPPPDGLDAFAAWFSEQRTNERFWEIEDRTDFADVYWTKLTMADVVTAFRATRPESPQQ